ncbi:MAG: hypothetical protein ABH828_03015 [archaeon]
MKRIVLLLVVLMLLVVGCNSTPEEAKGTEVKTTVTITGEDLPEAPEMPGEETEVEVTTTVGTSGAIDEWCLTGSTYDVTSTDGSVSTKIVGIETYKGKQFCKGVQTTNIQGVGEVQTTYYFNEEAQEMWVVSTIAGQTTEIHIVDGEIAS